MRVLLLASCGPLNLKVVYCLEKAAARIHVVATTPSNIVARSRHIASFVVHPDISSPAAPQNAVSWLRDYCASHAIDVVIPGDMGTAGFLAAAGTALGSIAVYPCSGAAMLHRIHDKWLFASTLMQAGIPTPKTALIESPESIESVSEEIGFPMVVKPLSAESGHGVARIDSTGMLRAHIRGNTPYSHLPLIAQRFIPGRDIDVSVLADSGKVVLGVTQQFEPDSSLRIFHDAETRRLGEAIVAEFGYHGIAHFDMRIDERTGAIVALECNPRFWYSMPASMWQGANFVEAGIRHARGECIADRPVLQAGRYYLPGALLMALRRPWTLRNLTLRNIRGFLQPALDPLPHLVDLYRKRRTARNSA